MQGKTGFIMEAITLKVGSQGFLNLQGFMALISILNRTTLQTQQELSIYNMQKGYYLVTQNLDSKEYYNLEATSVY